MQNELAGGGLPPSAVTGLITITETTGNTTTTTQEKFCIGCGCPGSQARRHEHGPVYVSAGKLQHIGTMIPKNLKRTLVQEVGNRVP